MDQIQKQANSDLFRLFLLPLLCLLVIAATFSHQLSPVPQLQLTSSERVSSSTITTIRTDPEERSNRSSHHQKSTYFPEGGATVPIRGFRQIKHELIPLRSGLPYRYTAPEESGIDLSGAEFDVNPDLIDRLGLPPESYFDLNLDTVKDFSFVTAADESHYSESIDCVASIQRQFPDYLIHYYDIGLREDQRTNVTRWCNVELHSFPLSDYPAHISDITNKCFKYLIIQRALRSDGAVFWVDASFRASHSISQWDDVFRLALANGGIVMAEYKPDSDVNIHWTHPMMFYFLVTNLTNQIRTKQFQSGAVLIYNTEWAFTRVLWWMYLCSLEPR